MTVQLPIDMELQELVIDYLLDQPRALKVAEAWANNGLDWESIRKLPKDEKRNIAAITVSIANLMKNQGHPLTMALIVATIQVLILGLYMRARRTK